MADHFRELTGLSTLRVSRNTRVSSVNVRAPKPRVSLRDALGQALQCCVDVQDAVRGFENPPDVREAVPGAHLTIHIGVGCGQIAIMQVGGELGRWEYVVAGPPLAQISIAEPLASSGETVVSPQVYALANDIMVVGPEIKVPHSDFKLLLDIKPRIPPAHTHTHTHSKALPIRSNNVSKMSHTLSTNTQSNTHTHTHTHTHNQVVE
eukprot:GHVR01002503.1.p1 GENE.GHVR01002503.1~~GHVR01002503.1.p1  ORF type:complete len:207 (-),score=80.06 GHVR01002503.1:351-971(-)